MKFWSVWSKFGLPIVCVCVCVHARMRVCMRACVRACVCVCDYVQYQKKLMIQLKNLVTEGQMDRRKDG